MCLPSQRRPGRTCCISVIRARVYSSREEGLHRSPSGLDKKLIGVTRRAQRRIGCRQDGEHEEGHPVPRRHRRRPAPFLLFIRPAGSPSTRRRDAVAFNVAVGQEATRATRAADPRGEPDPRGVRKRSDRQEQQFVPLRTQATASFLSVGCRAEA